MSSYASSRFVSSRAPSVSLDSRSRASSQALDTCEARRPPLPSSKRWSSVLEYGSGRPVKYENYAPTTPMARASTPIYPSYHEALIKSSQNLRERSMSPSAPAPVNLEKYSPYKCNMDYYRGKVKSVYEKEPVFKDFVRNIPLSESNLYDNTNLSRIKRRFNNMLQDKWGRDKTPDPFKPSGNNSGIYEPASENLRRKHKSVPPAAAPLPFIYVYHRNSRR
eukprot:TRINITY_DN3791_c0_g1_i1.p1 TRINITY_DN3791_c0_g1~~TRINITY_DN3791_c0_g1_i1.p1  ORF type:complete len:221 (+),score=26.83 TRINITY_DN3791_c0_g1_i1:35-697(+)